MSKNESIQTIDDVLNMLDHLIKENSRFEWDAFYTNREKNIPFFANKPDENLVEYFDSGQLTIGNVLELGCGPGRNAIYLAEKGCKVDALDLSEEAIQWGNERAKEKAVNVNFILKNIFEMEIGENSYDLVYDSGCFHHIAPHRRISYLQLLHKAIAPGGYFALTCFIENGEFGGSTISDWDVYRHFSLHGGLGFTEDKLRNIFKDFEVIEIRRMKDVEHSASVFGTSGLLAALFHKKL
ncbi:methyltransferase family protein [Bacillus oleivorans]|uniref:Methyltransferase family protein n=1 Tax=Bacillus oleivorans TaxID=1448271 RepID=A0A285D5H2_9BACI|nr:class I SAM-dependent methyltransferase [Bacillus oleivorans]SNX74915.1 methyltransferase family protein [Bacillus oleivorans]